MEYEISHFMVSQSNSASHLCSRSLHLSQSEWSTPGPCHISHIGSTSCATAGGGERYFKFNNDTWDFQLQCDELHLLSSQDYIKLSSKLRTNQWVINNNNKNAAYRLTRWLLFLKARRRRDFIDCNCESASKRQAMWNQPQLLGEAASLRLQQQRAGFNKERGFDFWLTEGKDVELC